MKCRIRCTHWFGALGALRRFNTFIMVTSPLFSTEMGSFLCHFRSCEDVKRGGVA